MIANISRTALNLQHNSVSKLLLSPSSKRCVPSLSRFYSYEGDGKTTVTILNKEADSPLMIDAYGTHGFRLNNGMHVIGPMAIFPKSVLSWNVQSVHDITVQSLSLFALLEPKLDILLLGCGDTSMLSRELYVEMRQKGIFVEMLKSEHACTTFNFLNVERRSVAAAIIPPVKVEFVDQDIINSQLRRKILFADLTEDSKS